MKNLKRMPLIAILLISPFFIAHAFAAGRNPVMQDGKKNEGEILQMKTVADTGGKKIEAFKKEWNKKIDLLNKKISEAQKKANTAKVEDKEKLENKISDLKAKKQDLQQEVNKAVDISASKWKSFKSNVAKEYNKLSRSVDSLVKR